MRKALALIVAGAAYRLVPHPANAVPMGALSLYAGASLPRRWAWLVPVSAMVVSDLALDLVNGRPFLDASRWVIYATFAATTLLGPLARRPRIGPWLLPALSLCASALFFLTSNFGAWLASEVDYPRSLGGLFTCYVAGLPFVTRTILADLAGTAVLFGLGSVLERFHRDVPATEAPVAVTSPQAQS